MSKLLAGECSTGDERDVCESTTAPSLSVTRMVSLCLVVVIVLARQEKEVYAACTTKSTIDNEKKSLSHDRSSDCHTRYMNAHVRSVSVRIYS
jgi:hypothetical protein